MKPEILSDGIEALKINEPAAAQDTLSQPSHRASLYQHDSTSSLSSYASPTAELSTTSNKASDHKDKSLKRPAASTESLSKRNKYDPPLACRYCSSAAHIWCMSNPTEVQLQKKWLCPHCLPEQSHPYEEDTAGASEELRPLQSRSPLQKRARRELLDPTYERFGLDSSNSKSISSLCTHTVPRPIDKCILVSRNSTERDNVNHLHKRNSAHFTYFQESIHPCFHDCSTFGHACEVTQTSIVLNRISSNENMATSRRLEIQHLRSSLDASSQASHIEAGEIVLLVSSDEGLTTHVPGFEAFFSEYTDLPLSLVILKAPGEWEAYSIRNILDAIRELKAGNALKKTKELDLVISMTATSVSKEYNAIQLRSVRDYHKYCRNQFDIAAVPVSTLTVITNNAPTKAELMSVGTHIGRTRVGKANARYQICQDGTHHKCLIEGCSKQFKHRDDLDQHLLEHCSRAGICLLCTETNNDADKAFDKRFKHFRDGLNHIKTHLPPTFACPIVGCEKLFRTKESLSGHSKTLHKLKVEPSRTVAVLYCSANKCSFVTTDAADFKRHADVHEREVKRKLCTFGCGAEVVSLRQHEEACKLNPDRILMKCPECGRGYRSRPALWAHQRKAHVRNAEVMGWANSINALTSGPITHNTNAYKVVTASMAALFNNENDIDVLEEAVAGKQEADSVEEMDYESEWE